MKRKQVNLILDEKLYECVRHEAFGLHISMNQLIRGYISKEFGLPDSIQGKPPHKTQVELKSNIGTMPYDKANK